MVNNVGNIRQQDFPGSIVLKFPVDQIGSDISGLHLPGNLLVGIWFPDRTAQIVFLHEPPDLLQIHHDRWLQVNQPHVDASGTFTISSELVSFQYFEEIFAILLLPLLP